MKMINKLTNIVNNAKINPEREVTGLKLTNIKGESVISLKRWDSNTWILNPGTKNEEIVRIDLMIEGEEI